ncbi:MAG: hypothetical protein GXP63_01780 [DPANN group archaeon]|nr:hypothetical protein [DPANN group archaeon]
MRGIPTRWLTPFFFLLAISLVLVSSFFLTADRPDRTLSENKVTGKVATRLFVISSYPLECNTTLIQGYNLYELHCIPSNASPSSVFRDYLSNITSIHTYHAGSDDPWSAYNPRLPSWVVQDLTSLERTQGYWMRMFSNTSVSINGTYSLPVRNDLIPGWNLAGYALQIPKNVTDALSGIDTKFTLILGYNATDSMDPWKSYDPSINDSFNDLHRFEPHHGYWINMTANGTWYLDE